MLTRYKVRKKGKPSPDVEYDPSKAYNVRGRIPPELQIQYDEPPYDPASPQAVEFHASTKQIRCAFGGNRGGKSELGGFELVDMARKYPGYTFWACSISQDFVKIAASKIYKYLAKDEIEKEAWYNSARRIPSYIRLKNGSEIEFKTYKSGIESFAGASVKGVWLDEDPAMGVIDGEAIFVECLQRGIDCRGRLWITATPVLGRNWMYDRLYRKGADQDEYHRENPNIDVWTISLLDNKFVGEEEKANAKRNLSQDEIGRRFYGVFTTLSGAIFKEWDPERHTLRPFPKVGIDWRHARGIDLGYDHPFCCLWGALSPDNVLFIYAEHHQRATLIKDHVARITEIDGNWDYLTGDKLIGFSIEETVCDHDRQERAELEDQGVYSSPAEKTKDIGFQICNRAFKQDRIFISPECYWLIKELSINQYKPASRGGKEEEIDKDNDATAAFRYLVMYFFGHGEIDYSVESE